MSEYNRIPEPAIPCTADRISPRKLLAMRCTFNGFVGYTRHKNLARWFNIHVDTVRRYMRTEKSGKFTIMPEIIPSEKTQESRTGVLYDAWDLMVMWHMRKHGAEFNYIANALHRKPEGVKRKYYEEVAKGTFEL